ncbi:MAG: response regulator [Bacteroidetes bacterium]|nr:response regulator [Bacteroidota bacterium]MBU1719189.1 response regulator [Bacteroidota bacterium]
MTQHKNILLIQTSILGNNALELALQKHHCKVYKVFTLNTPDPEVVKMGFDCIIIDVLMPEITGFEILEDVVGMKMPQTPVVMLSYVNHPESHREAIKKGAADFIHKPMDSDILANRLLKIINTYSLVGA